MKKLSAYIDLALDLATAYCRMQCDAPKPPKPYKIVMQVLAALLLLTAIGFGLAAAFIGMLALGAAVASLLTAVIALAGGLALLLVVRWRQP